MELMLRGNCRIKNKIVEADSVDVEINLLS